MSAPRPPILDYWATVYTFAHSMRKDFGQDVTNEECLDICRQLLDGRQPTDSLSRAAHAMLRRSKWIDSSVLS